MLAAESMKLRGGYSAIGLTPDVGSSWFLARRAGEALVTALVTALPRGATGSMARIKALVDGASQRTLAQQLDLEHRYMVESGRTADAIEGVTAFSEKRAPVFGRKPARFIPIKGILMLLRRTLIATALLCAFTLAGAQSKGVTDAELLAEDNGYEPKRAVLAAQKLVAQKLVARDGAFAILGQFGTATNRAALPFLIWNEVCNFMPQGASSGLYDPPSPYKIALAPSYFSRSASTIDHMMMKKAYERGAARRD